jgi:hypothetical protein
MPRKRKPSTDAVEILHRRYYEGRPDMLAALEEARANDGVARKTYELRTKAGLKWSLGSEIVCAAGRRPGIGILEQEFSHNPWLAFLGEDNLRR